MSVKSIYRKILVGFDKELLNRLDAERKLLKLDRTKFIRKAVLTFIVSQKFKRAAEEK
jgi:metal-responsive CopG/Arc/MetJ family transcriptional regulator